MVLYIHTVILVRVHVYIQTARHELYTHKKDVSELNYAKICISMFCD